MRHLIQDKIFIRRINLLAFPTIGDTRFFYIDDTTKKQYYWDGSAYVEMFVSGGGGGVASVNGTTNRITSTGGANPVIDIDPTFIASKQDTLVSGTNIKTVHNVSLLGSGNISLTPFKQNTTSALTGTTSETLITSILIPANTFQSNDWLRWIMSINATGNANSKILKFYFNTSAAVGGVQVAQRTLPNVVTQVVIRNMFFVNSLSSQKTIVGTTLNAASDEATTGTQATLSIDFSIDQYFVVSGTLAVGTDTITINGISSKISR